MRIIAPTHLNCFYAKIHFPPRRSFVHRVHEWWWINVSIMKRKFIMSSRGEWQKQIVLKLSLRWERRSASRYKFHLRLNCYSNDIILACRWTCIAAVCNAVCHRRTRRLEPTFAKRRLADGKFLIKLAKFYTKIAFRGTNSHVNVFYNCGMN